VQRASSNVYQKDKRIPLGANVVRRLGELAASKGRPQLNTTPNEDELRVDYTKCKEEKAAKAAKDMFPIGELNPGLVRERHPS
jgi:hypothetical protein